MPTAAHVDVDTLPPQNRQVTGPGHAWPALAALAVLALAVRLFLLFRADWMADYDESVIGLMAIDITRGSHPSLFYGQPYMGSFEAYLAAPLFALFGVSRQILKLVPLSMTVPWLVTTYLLMRRLSGHRAGLLAALLVALAPVYVLVNTLKAGSGTTAEVMPLGNLALLAVVNAVDSPSRGKRAIWWACAGLALGFGFWLHALIAYYAVAAAAYALFRRPSTVLRLESWLTIPAFALGAEPLLAHNLRRGWPTFSYLFDTGRPKASEFGLDAIVPDMLGRLVPRVFGPGSYAWQWLGWPATFVVILAVVAMLWVCVRARVQRQPASAEVAVLLAFAVPGVYLLSGFGNAAINSFSIDSAGRYLVPLYSVAPLAIGFAFARISGKLAIGAAVIVLASGIAGHAVTDGAQVLQSPYYNRAPASFAPVIAALREEGIAHVWTDVGLGHPLMFQSKEEILTADFRERMDRGPVRFPDAYKAVEKATRTAFLVAILPKQIGPLERELRRLAVPYHKREIGNLALLVPERLLQPATVASGLGFQY